MAEENGNGGMPDNNDQAGDDNLTFDGWIGTQDETVQQLIDGHVNGLKSALTTERNQRKELAKALKEATKELEKGTDARSRLEEISGQLEAAEKRLSFAEAMAGQVTNVKLAWLAAQEIGAVDQTGAVNMESLKANYPELFVKKTVPAGNAGDGAGGSRPGPKDMNSFIRTAAGRK